MGANKIVLLGADFGLERPEGIPIFQRQIFEKTSHWDGKDHEWYKLKRPEIFRSLERLKNLLKQKWNRIYKRIKLHFRESSG